jgi:signal transduction histidine kinase
MWSKLSLAIKGLILVSVPLLFEVGFVLVLTHYQQQAEIAAQKAVEARNISDKVTNLTSDIYSLYMKISAVGPDLRQGKLNTGYRPVLIRVLTEYAELDKLTADSPEIHKAVKTAQSAMQTANRILDQALVEAQAGNVDKVVATYEEKCDDLKKLLQSILGQDLLIIVARERHTATSSDESEAMSRTSIVRIVYSALAFNIACSILLALFFFKTVVGRLNVMSDNAVRLASNQPLHSRLSGQDEIAKLDLAFHQMADTIVDVSRTKEELVGMLTHDLRTPLTFIQGCLDMMSQGMLGQLNERGTKLVKLANRNSFLMMGLINDLLDSQKIQSSMMTIECHEVCVAEVFEQVREITADWVEEHGISIKVQDTDIFVSGDQEKLCRVLLNLVSNAVKYSKEGDVITIAAREISPYAEIIVADQGPGIPKDMLKAVFDRFQQVSGDAQAKKGSGLGLSICKDLVGLHGGRIWATSEKGQGTVFHFTVPLA